MSPQEQPLLGSTPIQALPPASAIDLDVLDALPLHLKRELERAYGEAMQLLHTSLQVHVWCCELSCANLLLPIQSVHIVTIRADL
jgi:hypothetical protein